MLPQFPYSDQPWGCPKQVQGFLATGYQSPTWWFLANALSRAPFGRGIYCQGSVKRIAPTFLARRGETVTGRSVSSVTREGSLVPLQTWVQIPARPFLP